MRSRMAMHDEAVLLMRLLDMEPYPWQCEFFELYCREPHEHLQVDWERVLYNLAAMSQDARRSGRTTALAIWLAVDPYLVDWEPRRGRSTWVNDHYSTMKAAVRLAHLAMEYKHRWQKFESECETAP